MKYTISVASLNKLSSGLNNKQVTHKWLNRNFTDDENAFIVTRFPLISLGLKILNRYDVTAEEAQAYLEVVQKQVGAYDPVKDKVEW